MCLIHSARENYVAVGLSYKLKQGDSAKTCWLDRMFSSTPVHDRSAVQNVYFTALQVYFSQARSRVAFTGIYAVSQLHPLRIYAYGGLLTTGQPREGHGLPKLSLDRSVTRQLSTNGVLLTWTPKAPAVVGSGTPGNRFESAFEQQAL